MDSLTRLALLRLLPRRADSKAEVAVNPYNAISKVIDDYGFKVVVGVLAGAAYRRKAIKLTARLLDARDEAILLETQASPSPPPSQKS